MSDIIKLLPDSVANQIAAGEVIQRPASVIKELVENAIDAHATSIQIVLKDAGRTLIQVIDDGQGMTDTDARLAFERHSTSKIAKAEDLFDLHTMGFRGEALASIAAISHVELRTRAKDAQLGTKLLINASQCDSQEPIACPQGCNFMIKDIFYNVPARRKFLKSNQVELSNIVKEFEKLALVNHDVEFTMSNNDNYMYKLLPGTFKQRISALFGRNIGQQLIPINIDTTLAQITGFICKPENARKRNCLQYFFVNGRFMRHPYFHKAIMSSYGQLIPDDEQPNYFLNFNVDPETIDVNIHPTKSEIKFENEMPIWQILAAAVKESLGRFIATPQIDFDTDGAPQMSAFANQSQAPASPTMGVDPNYNPFDKVKRATGQPVASTYHKPAPMTDWDALYRNFERKKQDGINQAIAIDPMPSSLDSVPSVDTDSTGTLLTPDISNSCMQLHGRYIVSPVKSGLMIIDQHRAHVRVLYEQYMAQIDGKNITSQSVLFPEILNLNQAQSIILKELQTEMEKIGFSLSQLSGGDWSINAVPAGMDGVDIKDTILQVIDSVQNGGTSISDKVYDHLALTVARSAALHYGKELSQDEMDNLTAKLLSLPNPGYTPDGKKVIVIITDDQIDKMF